MTGDMGHKDGLKKPAPGADNTEPVFQIPVGLPSLERGCHVKKNYRVQSTTIIKITPDNYFWALILSSDNTGYKTREDPQPISTLFTKITLFWYSLQFIQVTKSIPMQGEMFLDYSIQIYSMISKKNKNFQSPLFHFNAAFFLQLQL